MDTRGVILAGGKGTRLGHLTRVTNKHLLPVAYKPMIFYPLQKLVAAGVKDIMIVSGTEHMGAFIELLGSGKEFGCSLTYRVQDEAGGIAQALGLAERFARDSTTIVLLGDNIFFDSLDHFVVPLVTGGNMAWLALKAVEDPSQFGVAVFKHREGAGKELVEIVEKPKTDVGNMAVTGIYAYPPDVYDVIKTLKPSARGELEITDVNNFYLRNKRLAYIVLGGFWTDAGTLATLAKATRLVEEHGIKYNV